MNQLDVQLKKFKHATVMRDAATLNSEAEFWEQSMLRIAIVALPDAIRRLAAIRDILGPALADADVRLIALKAEQKRAVMGALGMEGKTP